MSEKVCVQWNDFQENNSGFGRLRDDFTDVTLACEDGQQMEAHKVILAASSPFFEKILRRNKHPHPLIYLRGFQSKELLAILDLLYFGEANVYQESLDSFLAIAEELKLKVLMDKIDNYDVVKETESQSNPKSVNTAKEVFRKSTAHNSVDDESVPEVHTAERSPNKFNGDLLGELHEKVKSLMEKSDKMVPNGKHYNGTPKHKRGFICKVCGKEGHLKNIRDHIEANHLEGILIPCDSCGKSLGTRNALNKHICKKL